jgi:hypothetical protein
MKINIRRFSPARAPILACVASVFIVSSALFGAQARASERWATLEAIHQLENPHNTSEPGQYGELGPYQFRESTWRMYTQAPFSQALDRRTADVVAVKHYNWLKAQLESHGLAATPYRIALAWNSGIGAVVAGSSTAASEDYASRAANIAGELETREVVDLR